MAMVTRRYVLRGVSLEMVILQLGPATTMAPGTWYPTKDVTYDDALTTQAFVDEVMATYGFLPDLKNTIVLSPNPFMGLLDANGFVWKLQVSLAGIVTAVKVS